MSVHFVCPATFSPTFDKPKVSGHNHTYPREVVPPPREVVRGYRELTGGPVRPKLSPSEVARGSVSVLNSTTGSKDSDA